MPSQANRQRCPADQRVAYVESAVKHDMLAAVFGRLDDGTNGVVKFECGSGSGWVNILYLMQSEGAHTPVPYGPFHRWKVCE